MTWSKNICLIDWKNILKFSNETTCSAGVYKTKLPCMTNVLVILLISVESISTGNFILIFLVLINSIVSWYQIGSLVIILLYRVYEMSLMIWYDFLTHIKLPMKLEYCWMSQPSFKQFLNLINIWIDCALMSIDKTYCIRMLRKMV